MKKRLLFFLVALLTISALHAQSISPFTFNVAGGSYQNSNSYHRFEWSFGEAMIINLLASADSALIVTHGVLQPCTEKAGNSPAISFFGMDEYRLFPNPVTEKFELNFFIRQSGRMTLKLVDATGRELDKRSYQYNGCCRIEQYDLSRYANGVYYVIADLEPTDNSSPRHGGFKVVKLRN